jgi:hypothetical protein
MTTPTAVTASVESSLLASISYSIHASLDLRFRSGACYRYFAVPQSVFDELLAAPSKGAYFNRNVRGRFRYQRLA